MRPEQRGVGLAPGIAVTGEVGDGAGIARAGVVPHIVDRRGDPHETLPAAVVGLRRAVPDDLRRPAAGVLLVAVAVGRYVEREVSIDEQIAEIDPDAGHPYVPWQSRLPVEHGGFEHARVEAHRSITTGRMLMNQD